MKILWMLMVAVLALGGCQKVSEQKPEEIEAPLVSISVSNVIVTNKSGEKTTLTVEIARTNEERQKGLQNRSTLGEDHGMWFVFDADELNPFWMKDTLLSLDMIFVDADMKIVDLFQTATPGSADQIYSSRPYRYVLEVNAGLIAKHQWQVGDSVEWRVGTP